MNIQLKIFKLQMKKNLITIFKVIGTHKIHNKITQNSIK